MPMRVRACVCGWTDESCAAVERAKALSAKSKENEKRLREMEIEVTTSRVRQEDLRRREMSAGDEKRRAEQQLSALKAEVGGVESELRAARDALAAAYQEAMNQNRAHAALQGLTGRLRWGSPIQKLIHSLDFSHSLLNFIHKGVVILTDRCTVRSSNVI